MPRSPGPARWAGRRDDDGRWVRCPRDNSPGPSCSFTSFEDRVERGRERWDRHVPRLHRGPRDDRLPDVILSPDPIGTKSLVGSAEGASETLRPDGVGAQGDRGRGVGTCDDRGGEEWVVV